MCLRVCFFPGGGGISRGLLRYFVANNEAYSFAVYYFEREEQSDRPSKRRGEIFMSGYSVRCVKREEEIKELGEHTLVLEVGARTPAGAIAV